jgi:mannose-1-phosphate guanylyltransferase
MIIVIIAGGSGTRLWPLSTGDYPKQLLKLTNDKSLIQNTYERVKRLSDDIYIVPDISHAHFIKEQLPDLDNDHFVVEPGRRGTANCMLAALAHISTRHSHDEPIAFLWADHHVRDTAGFVRSFMIAAENTTKAGRIALIGVEPAYAATGFNYIERSGEIEGLRDAYGVVRFTEKPNFKTAKKFIANGNYLWNSGYFFGSVNTIIKTMTAEAPELMANYETLMAAGDPHSKVYEDAYLALESNTTDAALMEKSKNLMVISANFDWMDLGSFKDLHEANESDEQGNHFYGSKIYPVEVENVYVRNEEDKPVAVIGLDNIVVINTKHGILVARKDLSQKVGDVAKFIEQERNY